MFSLPVNITRIEEDLDNDLLILNIKNDEKKIRGRVEVPKNSPPGTPIGVPAPPGGTRAGTQMGATCPPLAGVNRR